MPADPQHHVARIGPALRHLPLPQLMGEIGRWLTVERWVSRPHSLPGVTMTGRASQQAPRRIAPLPENGRRVRGDLVCRLIGTGGIVGRYGELLRRPKPLRDPGHLRVLPPPVGIGAHLPFQIADVQTRQSRRACPVAGSVKPVAGEAGIGRTGAGTAQGDKLPRCCKPAIGGVVDVGAGRRCRKRQGDAYPSAEPDELHGNGTAPASQRFRRSSGRFDHLRGVALPKAAAPFLLMVLAACKPPPEERHPMPEADAERGRAIIARVGCASCHTVPGIRWPQGQVGPSLHGFAASNLISGKLPNRPDVLAAYVANAPAMLPGTTMPAMPINEREARDVAAYLYTLEP